MRGSGDIPDKRLDHFAPALAGDVFGLPKTFVAVGALADEYNTGLHAAIVRFLWP